MVALRPKTNISLRTRTSSTINKYRTQNEEEIIRQAGQRPLTVTGKMWRVR